MIILGQSQGFPSRTFIFCRSQCPFDWESYAEVMQCLVPIMLCKTSFFIIKLYPLIVNLHLHTSVPKFNPIKELRNGGGIFIFNGFCLRSFTKIAHTDDEMLQTINFRKATYINTNLLYYLILKGYAMKFYLMIHF